jgi:hypothetical protein
MAGLVYTAILAMIVGLFILGGLVDAALWVSGRETISQWLRKHPDWFWWPCYLALLFLAGLAMHLWLTR